VRHKSAQKIYFEKKCASSWGKNFVLKKLPQFLWQKKYLKKNATNSVAKKNIKKKCHKK